MTPDEEMVEAISKIADRAHATALRIQESPALHNVRRAHLALAATLRIAAVNFQRDAEV